MPTLTSYGTAKKRPIRIFLEDGRNDQRALAQDGTYAETRDWFFQNVRLTNALTEKGYDVNYTWCMGKQGGGLLPDMLRWRDQPVSTNPRNMEERSFHEPPAKTARTSRFAPITERLVHIESAELPGDRGVLHLADPGSHF